MSYAHSPLTVAEDCGLMAAPDELEEPEQAAGERKPLPFGELGYAWPSDGASGEGAGVESSVSSATGCSAAGFRRGCPATICPKFLKCHTRRHEETLKKLYVLTFPSASWCPRRADAPGPRILPIDLASKRCGTGTRARSIGDRLVYLVLAGLAGRVSVVVGERRPLLSLRRRRSDRIVVEIGLAVARYSTAHRLDNAQDHKM